MITKNNSSKGKRNTKFICALLAIVLCLTVTGCAVRPVVPSSGAGAADSLYDVINPYLGDMPANGKVSKYIGIADVFGNFTNELQTSEEPYGWTMIFENPISDRERDAALEIINSDSYAMLASIENMGYVTWRFPIGDDEFEEFAVDAEDATEFLGADVKSFSKSPESMAELLKLLPYKPTGMRNNENLDQFFMCIAMDTSDEIESMSINYYINDEISGSVGVGSDDKNFLKSGIYTFGFGASTFDAEVTPIELANMKYDIHIQYEGGRDIAATAVLNLFAQYGRTYSFALSGNAEQDFQFTEL